MDPDLRADSPARGMWRFSRSGRASSNGGVRGVDGRGRGVGDRRRDTDRAQRRGSAESREAQHVQGHLKLSTYKVTYKWTIVAGGQTQTSEQTWYYKAPKARFDFSAGPGSLFSVFTLEDGTYICTTSGSQAFCQKSPGGTGLDANPAASFGVQFQDHPEQFNASFQGTRSIAGQTAQCYGVKSVSVGAFSDVTSCYSSSGVPLLTKMSSQGQEFTMEASTFSTTVTDADFKLPAAAN